MHNWRILDKIVLYDGTFMGLLSIVYSVVKNKYLPIVIECENEYIDNLFHDYIFIPTDDTNAKKVLNKINSNIYVFYKVYTSFISNTKTKEIDILKYILKYLKHGNKINFMKNDETVIKISKICRAVKSESHRLKGFLRFKELENGVLFADISPENNIIEILVNHFKERLKNESWIILDTKRKIAAMYNKGNYELLDYENNCEINFSEKEELFQSLWKSYFKTIAIKERTNKRCQMNFMPKKYWKYLVEDAYDKTS